MSNGGIERDRERYTLAIVESDSPKRLILGGPGTGKSFTFKLALERVGGGGLALTFIRNLVADLETELEGLAEARTFHGFCKLLLYRHPVDPLEHPLHYYPPLYTLIQEDLEHLYPESEWSIENIEQVFHDLEEGSELARECLSLGEHYNAVSYVDSVFRVLRFFRENRDQIPIYNLLVVDEFQDFSLMEKEFIALLADRNSALIAGDDDQALYGFRYASSRYIRDLAAEDSDYAMFELPYCSRCTQVVVDAFHDVLGSAQARGLLENRLEKAFRCFTPSKRQESAEHPHIIHAHCSVERGNLRYIGRYVAARIAEIPDDEVAESHTEGETTVLVIGPPQFVKRAVPVLVERHANVQHTQSKQPSTDILDGYRLLMNDEDSRLGWRIVSHEAQFNGYPEAVSRSIREGISLGEVAPREYKERHIRFVSHLRKLAEGQKLTAAEEAELCEAIGRDLSEVLEAVGLGDRDEDDVANEEELVEDEPTILCTTLLGAKGRSAYYVFMVGVNNHHLPRDPDDIENDEVRQFLVGLTRTRRQCYLVSVGRFGAVRGEPSTFVEWIDNSRIRYEYVNKAFLEDLEGSLGWGPL